MKLSSIAILMALVLVPFSAQAKKYTFDVPEKLVNIQFESEMEVEDILGTSNTISGELDFQGENRGTFRFAVPIKTLRTGIDLRDDHLRSAYWLDGDKFPNVTFEGRGIKSVGRNKYEVSGTFTLHGVSKSRTITIRAQEIEGARAKKLGLAETPDGSWLRIRGSFPVKLSEHGVQIPDMAAAKVNDKWTVKVSLFARESR